MATTRRYFFSQDEDCHWYMIPADRRVDWERLSNLENAWELEEWEEFENYRLDGGISHLEFFEPIESAVTS